MPETGCNHGFISNFEQILDNALKKIMTASTRALSSQLIFHGY
jgi:ribosomal protein S4